MLESTGTPYSFKEQPTVDAAKEMLQSLRALVPNSGNISRLQEECDLLCLALVHYEQAHVGCRPLGSNPEPRP